jgi:hypothetical protein
VKSLISLQKAAVATADSQQAGAVKDLAEICADLAQHIESIQRQIDEAKRHDTRRRQGLS